MRIWLSYSYSTECTVGEDGSDISEYLSASPERIENIKLPLGASLRRVGTLTHGGEEEFTVVLPVLQFFEVWLQPTAQSWVT